MNNKRQLKQTITSEESSSNRRERHILLRKTKKEETLMKRRKETPVQMDTKQIDTVTQFPMVIEKMKGNVKDIKIIMDGLIFFRRFLSQKEIPSISKVIESGVIDLFVLEILKSKREIWDGEMGNECLWILINVCSNDSDYVGYLLERNLLQILALVLKEASHMEVLTNAIWLVGNIAGEGVPMRDLCLSSLGNIFDPVSRILKSDVCDKDKVKDCIWSLNNLIRGKPSPKYFLVKDFIFPCRFVIMKKITSSLRDALWAVSSLTDFENSFDSFLFADNENGIPFARNILEIINSCLDENSPFVNECGDCVLPCVRIIGNFCSDDDKFASPFIEAGLILVLKKLLAHQKKIVVKEVLFTFSNLCVSKKFYELVLAADILKVVVFLLAQGEFEIKREALHLLSGISCHDSKIAIEVLRNDALFGFVQSLKTEELAIVALEGLAPFIAAGRSISNDKNNNNVVIQKLESLGIIDACEKLLVARNANVRDFVDKFLKKNFKNFINNSEVAIIPGDDLEEVSKNDDYAFDD